MSLLWLVLALLPVLGSGERFSCKGRILGAYYADAKSGCKAFHVCVRVLGGGIRDFRFFCPPGTLFHQEAQTCTDWGDDDPLACPADIYDGQFDLYKIGSGFDTKKLSSTTNREEESEFGLQRAETGDRRLSQNNSPSAPASDLRAAHSSDFFSGQRERGRDDSVPSQGSSRQSFRRPTTRVPPTSPSSTQAPTRPPTPYNSPHHDFQQKRKLVRKRPVYTSPSTTLTPTTFTQNYPTPRPQQFTESQRQSIPQHRQSFPEQQRPNYSEQPRPNLPEQPRQNFPEQPRQNYPEQFRQHFSEPQKQSFSEQSQQNFARRPNENRARQQQSSLPAQYNEEYVEVSRVTPKAARFHGSTAAPQTYTEQQRPSTPQFNKKAGLTEVYNYDAQSTSAFTSQNENRPFKATVRNGFTVSSPITKEYENVTPRKNVEINSNGDRRTPEYNNNARNFGSSTPVYRNQNSVSYEPEKNNYFSGAKQNYAYTATQPPTTTLYTTSRAESPLNLNTVAYKTNIGFDARPSNFADNEEDDGQYRPPADEDDGQYRPELYEKELLSGAHSLNIAASGNRLPEDQKPRSKPLNKPAVPRPFSPSVPSSSPTRAPESTYTTTFRPQPTSTQRTFDYFQTYTTTSRPSETPVQNTPNQFVPTNTIANRAPTTVRSKPDPRPFSTRAPPQASTSTPKHRLPSFAQPAKDKEDNSYDYAYYDSDTGFSEYEQLEEFGKTKKKV